MIILFFKTYDDLEKLILDLESRGIDALDILFLLYSLSGIKFVKYLGMAIVFLTT